MVQGRLEVRHAHVAVDVEPLDLVEHGRVGGVVVAAVDLAEGHDPHRRRPRDHGADLDRGGVGPQHPLPSVGHGRLDEERVLHVPRRMVVGDVEVVEVGPAVLDVGPVVHRKAHGLEHPFEPPPGAGDHVQRPAGGGVEDDGQVLPAVEVLRPAALGQGAAPLGQGRLHLLLDRVEVAPERLARLGVEVPHDGPQAGQAPLLAEEGHLDRVERLLVRGGPGLGLEPLEFGFESWVHGGRR